MPSLSRARTLTPPRLAILLSLGLAGVTAIASDAESASDDVATLRARGPAALDELLARWDRTPAGAARDELGAKIDAVAAQRYATVSRLYWYTDLAAAEQAARALGRPILSLRMLGRLDEELSCANSRLFRATLYANASVSKLLRDRFVLHWSSERPVPRVTIDFGDGRKLERTTTGNSAHYVLDAAGHVLDVLPGLYAPTVFKAELTESLALAQRVRNFNDDARTAAMRTYHEGAQKVLESRFSAAGNTPFVRGRGARMYRRNEVGASAVARAQQATMSKAVVEVPDLGQLGFDAGKVSTDDIDAWTAAGQLVWNISGDLKPGQPSATLDAQSLALVKQIYGAGPVKTTPEQLAAMLAQLDRTLVADTALNELRLRAQIRYMLADGQPRTFDELNAWIYAEVFHTPKSDAWLGLLPRTSFTGLPGDGALVR